MKTLTARAAMGVLVIAATIILLLRTPEPADPPSPARSASGNSLDPDSAFFRGEYETAAALYRVMALAGRERPPGRHAELGVVRSLIAMGRFDEAERYVRRLDQDSTRTLSDVDSNLLTCLRSEIFTRRAEVPLAVEYATDCRRMIRPGRVDDALVRWYPLYVSAFAHAEADEFDVALGFYLEALALLADAGHDRSPEYARTINHIANVHHRTGSFSVARRLHEQALEIRLDLFVDHHPAVAASYGNIGNVFHAMGDFESALEHHLRALAIWTRSLGAEHPQTAYSLNNIGYAMNRLRRFDEAEYYLLRSRELKARVLSGNSLSLARTHRNLADAYLGQGNTHLATRYVNRALDAINESGHHSDILAAQALASKAEVLRFEGQSVQAASTLDTALEVAFEQNHPYAVVVLNNLARNQLRGGAAGEALDLANRAITFGSSVPGRIRPTATSAVDQSQRSPSMRSAHTVLAESHHILSTAYLELYRVSGDAGMLEKALGEVRRAIDTLDDSPLIRGDLTMSDFLTARLREYAQTGLELAVEFRDCDCGGEPIRDALTFSNILKNGFDYTDRLIRHYATGATGRAGSNRMDSLELSLFEAKRRRAVLDLDFAATPGRVEDLNATVFDIGRRLRKERGSIELSDEPGVLELYDSGPIDPGRLPDDLMLVDYTMLPDFVVAVTLTRSGASVHRERRTSRLNAMLVTFPDVVRRDDQLLFIVQSLGLYEALVRPLETGPDLTRLVISPHNALWDIPFDALLTSNPSRSGDGGQHRYDELPYLVLDQAVSYTTSAAWFMRYSLEPSREPPAGRLLAVAPGFGFEHALSESVRDFLSLHGYSHLEANRHTALSGSIEEVIRMKDAFHRSSIDNQVEVFTDENATEYAIKYELSTPHDIVHIATHGYASSRHPGFAGILLSPDMESRDDGILYAKEVQSLPIDARLIVVSSCYSGYSGGGEDPETRFIHALSSPDIHNIILALWPLSDRSTSDIATDIYTYIKSGIPVEESLRRAKLETIRRSPSSAHPSIWAPFVHVSNNRYGQPVI